MKRERLEVLNSINELTKEIPKTQLILDETHKIQALEINPHLEETILITAGCHGDEPAPVYAIQKFLEAKNFPNNKRIILVPCINPIGFSLDSETTKENVNINRDFKENSKSKEANFLKAVVEKYNPTSAINLHEDPDETDFYIWVEGDSHKNKAEKLIKELGVTYFKDKDIHGYQVKDGIILNAKGEDSFEDYLASKNIPNLCTETPGEWTMEKRVKVNINILKKIFN